MVTDLTHYKKSPPRTPNNQELVDRALDRGAVNAKVIGTQTITLGNWVRLRCQFGCPHFGKRFTCPTFTPTTHEMSDILMDYQKALVVEAESAAQVHDLVLCLEEQFREQGFRKAFALDSLPCNLCEVCTIESHCEHPDQARPTLQACGIDVSQTMSNIGWNTATSQEPCSPRQTVGMVLLD